MAAKIVLLALLWTTSITAYYDIDDSLLYKIEFPGPKKGPIVTTGIGQLFYLYIIT